LLRAQDTGNWKGQSISQNDVLQLLRDRIDSVSFTSIKEDIVRFIPNDSVLAIWTPQYFKDLIEKLTFREG